MSGSATMCQYRKNCRSHGFTLVELLTVIAIIAVLAGMLLSAIGNARDQANIVHCVNNLRGIGQATVLYENDFNSMPMGNLPVSLKPYDGNPRLYTCPEDIDQMADSYSSFFVYRGTDDSRQVLIMCNRHDDGKQGAFLYGMATAKSYRLASAYDNSGDAVTFGEEISTDTITFADTSSVKVTGAGSIVILSSFYANDDRLHTFVKVKQDHVCNVESIVNQGSGYEVITPAATAAALGTKYKVQVGATPSKFTSKLTVTEGTVGLSARTPHATTSKTPAGGGGNRSILKGKAPKDN